MKWQPKKFRENFCVKFFECDLTVVCPKVFSFYLKRDVFKSVQRVIKYLVDIYGDFQKSINLVTLQQCDQTIELKVT